jgi:hypothetical protein
MEGFGAKVWLSRCFRAFTLATEREMYQRSQGGLEGPVRRPGKGPAVWQGPGHASRKEVVAKSSRTGCSRVGVTVTCSQCSINVE